LIEKEIFIIIEKVEVLMRFASCRISGDRLLLSIFSKEYNKVQFEKQVTVKTDESSEIIRELDYIDMAAPSCDVLYYSRNYPPVKSSYLRKIIASDIESETPFREEEIIFDFTSTGGKSDTKVFCIKKETLGIALSPFEQTVREKIRSIIPENILLFKSPDNLGKAIFVGENYSALVTANGQIIKAEGIGRLRLELISVFSGSDPEEELNTWLNAAGDISRPMELTDVEMRIRKAVLSFFERMFAFFVPYAGEQCITGVFLNDILPNGSEKLIESMDSSIFSQTSFVVYSLTDSLEMIATVAENADTVNMASGEFAYKGGFTFLKRRIILGALLYAVALVLLVAGMQIRKGYLDTRLEEIDTRTKKVMKEVIGKELPSLRQAVAIMNKTIKGEVGMADKKVIYPYSSVYIMEVIFPYATFENSTIEISELSIKDEGKIRLVGTSSTLEDINKLTENLQKDPLISELNRGQINTRADKSAFNITFQFAGVKKEDLKNKKPKKKGSKGESEGEL